ncbi:uncharacterized protein [Triticum aestivum]|uniref:uncharacterized protein n=1 Tax=Triticum aestivum TaxID=4565 RepID=UPI001D00EC60|nr:uncharacterized protein LOC123042939 [Triticum aestivum]
MQGSNSGTMHDQMEQLCAEMEAAASFLRDKIKSATSGSSSKEAAPQGTDGDVTEQITELRRRICKLRSLVLGPAPHPDPNPRAAAGHDPWKDDESDSDEEEMTPEQLAMSDQFRREASAMEARLLEALEEDARGTPSCYRVDYTIPFSCSYQEENEEPEPEEEETEVARLAREEMETEERLFAGYREGWEYACGWRCGDFEDATALSPMHFAHYTPGLLPNNCVGGTLSTLQIYSVSIVEIKGSLDWPLDVYGIVAARDAVDCNRNLLFYQQGKVAKNSLKRIPFCASLAHLVRLWLRTMSTSKSN